MAGIADILDIERILEAHDAEADGAMAHVGILRFCDRVEVDVDHVVEHADRSLDGHSQFFLVEPFFCCVRSQVDRSQVANSRFFDGGVEQDLGAEIRAVNDAHMILWRADVRWIFEGDPGMACFKEHAEHLAPQLERFDSFEEFDFSFIAIFSYSL